MNWEIRNLEESPAYFDLKDESGAILNSIHLNRAALDFDAYVDETGLVQDRDFGKAKEAADRAVQNQVRKSEQPQELLFGEMKSEPAKKKRRK